MPTVFIPSLLRDLTGGQESVLLPGHTVGEVVDALERQFPGVKARLVTGESLRPGVTVVVDGEVSARRLRHKLGETSEVHFLPSLSGGSRRRRR